VGKKQFSLLLLIFTLVLLLRLPSLFEPYWYGDEGIYFAVAETLRRGGVLYRDVIDNKTPLIYYLFTLAGNQVKVRTLTCLWVLGTSLTIYFLGQLLLNPTGGIIAAAVCGILISLPLFEGNIANGELFFILPTTLATLLVFRFAKNNFKPIPLLWLIGFFLGLGLLFKFPAIFDAVAVGLFLAIAGSSLRFKKIATVQIFLWLGVATAVFPFATYFGAVGAFQDFLNASFFNNLSYTIAWESGFFSPKTLLLIKAVVGGLLISLLWIFRLRIPTENLLIWAWFFFSFLGATLSSRPYPHYLVQAIPSFSLLVAAVLRQQRYFLVSLAAVFFTVVAAIKFLHFTPSTLKCQFEYYQNFKDYILEKKDVKDYFAFFDPVTLRNYRVADYLRRKTHPEEKIFIWGDEALIYKLAQRQAAGRFVVAHHVNDIGGARQETINTLQREKPKYILIVKPIRFDFPLLFEILAKDYNKTGAVGNIDIYKMKN
jgi:4-amino-4-deoxy-L-arabinose transferase-like glycosyltransferase